METESEKPPPQSQYTTLAGFGKTKITTNDTQATPPDSTPHSTNSNILKETLSSKTDSKSWRPALFCPADCRPWTAMATATGLNIARCNRAPQSRATKVRSRFHVNTASEEAHIFLLPAA